ncbi:MAG: 3-deoxy-D-manno-octulosonic-acid transferase [Alteromonas macleodii]
MYLAVSHVTAPLFALVQRKALKNGKEDSKRAAERWGIAGRPRPDGLIVWFHAASVGETQSLLPLVSSLLDLRKDVTVLITSTTRTSAAMLADTLPSRVVHQMAPYDTVNASRAFLRHWQPDIAIWVESELWPRMLQETGARSIPKLYLNARVSSRTARRWTQFPASARAVLSSFNTINVQEKATFDALSLIGISGSKVVLTGSLKKDRPPLQCDENELTRLRVAIGDRSVWCAASTHSGEEEIMLAAHQSRAGLLILVPRHPDRAAAIADLSISADFKTARRSFNEAITSETQVYIADTMGELGLWFRLASASFIGGSLALAGGHNPYEAAQLGSAILHGPNVANFATIYGDLDQAGAAREVSDVITLGNALNLSEAEHRGIAAAANIVLSHGTGATDTALDAILEYLN